MKKLLKTTMLASVCVLLFMASDCQSPTAPPAPERIITLNVQASIDVVTLVGNPTRFLILYEDRSNPQEYQAVSWQLRFRNELVDSATLPPEAGSDFEVDDSGEYLLHQLLVDADGRTLNDREWEVDVP